LAAIGVLHARLPGKAANDIEPNGPLSIDSIAMPLKLPKANSKINEMI